ncbi:NAD(P)-dependent alcohol dehydrogenase [Alteribacter aurantiacus]|uniref:NAD(P)-dependent alcohol dehydrogenase n=1 Tax=Alteribacter aurantiacus TaxID=254410 RepID=UPI0003FBA164|nr:NAD(P)-dependent alcohol dehydrogenase [Alteribacter aurantiacus]
MKAIVCTAYGDPSVLQLREVKMPVPTDHEVLIKVHAASVTSADCRIRAFCSPPLFWVPMRMVIGITRPRRAILGVELSGVIAQVGKKVTRLKEGDPVFAMTGMKFGAYGEYCCLPEKGLIAIKPDQASFEEATGMLFGGTSALHFLRKGKITKDQRVLIYGASGAVGTSAVQLAKHFGANVTGVCSEANQSLVAELGADDVMNYEKEDDTRIKERYDLVFDAVGKITKAHANKWVTPTGIYVTVNRGMAAERLEDAIFLRELFQAGALKPVIDRVYPFEKIQEAHAYVDKGHKKGNVVVRIRDK